MELFQAGASSVSIDPGPEHVDNSIHGTMTVQVNQRGAPLFAKALALKLHTVTGLLITLDLVYLKTAHCEYLRRKLQQCTGANAGAIVVHCTHSHSTPMPEPLNGPHPFFDLICKGPVVQNDHAQFLLKRLAIFRKTDSLTI